MISTLAAWAGTYVRALVLTILFLILGLVLHKAARNMPWAGVLGIVAVGMGIGACWEIKRALRDG